MVLRVNSDQSSTALHNALPSTSSSSLCSSSGSDSDLECGYSSQDDNYSSSSSHHEQIISKFIPSHSGTMAPRRRSQCEQLTFRQRSEPLIKESGRRIPPQPAAFRRWSTLVTSSNGDLPKTVQFSPTDAVNSSSQSNRQRSPLLILATLMLAILATILTCTQQSQINSLKSELTITNSHRAYLEKSQSSLLSQLNQREASLNQFKHTHTQMTKVNHDMGVTMTKLREGHTRDVMELKRLRSAAAASASRSS